MCSGGHATLYASSFAAMTLHYVGELSSLPDAKKAGWVDYLNMWQEPETGWFIGPELNSEEMILPRFEWDYHTMHLTCHVLPALHLLGGRPTHPLNSACRFLDLSYLRQWLDRRDLGRSAWLEGNYLLFVGQLLVYLRDFQGHPESNEALRVYFDWLDSQQDPETGLWGTREGSSLAHAVYGGYHQLLVYYYCGHPVRYAERIIDSVLSLQHSDGGFEPVGGGGACQDVDSADILVNLGKRAGYRSQDIRVALQRLLESVLAKKMPSGGFVNRFGEPFMHHGILRTYVPPDLPDLFSTWFRTHTLALIYQFLNSEPLPDFSWRFNTTCSMGWHNPLLKHASQHHGVHQPPSFTHLERSPVIAPNYSNLQRMRAFMLGRPLKFLLRRVPVDLMLRLVIGILERYFSVHTSNEVLPFLLELDACLYPHLESLALEQTDRLLPSGWFARFSHKFFVERLLPEESVLHVGCETGSLTSAIATTIALDIVGYDMCVSKINFARQQYPHPRITFIVGDPLWKPPIRDFDAIVIHEVFEPTLKNPVYIEQLCATFHPKRILMRTPFSSTRWQTLLIEQMRLSDYDSAPLKADAQATKFMAQLDSLGLKVKDSKFLWGYTWLELICTFA